MDATRARRTRDPARQRWYAAYRSRRFARLLGFELAHVPANGYRPALTLGIARKKAVAFMPPLA
jgi:hypothetical protein